MKVLREYAAPTYGIGRNSQASRLLCVMIMRGDDMLIPFQSGTKELRKEGKEIMTEDELVEWLRKELGWDRQRDYLISEAEELADRVLQKFGYGKSGAVPIVKLVKKLAFSAFHEDMSGKSCSGNILIGGETYEKYGAFKVILADKNDPLDHQRFVIAHELGHYFLDYYQSGENDPKKQFAMIYPKNDHSEKFEEVRADRFAAQLLMPKKLFLKQYEIAVNRNDDRRYVIPYLSAYFGTKESSVAKRFRELGLK